MNSGRLQPALYGGLFIGVLSALPIVSAGNCCCCLWVVAGGVLAAYLRQQNSPYAIPASEGALVGMLAGLMGGVFGVLLSIPIEMAVGPLQQRMLEWVLENNPDIPVDTREMLGRAALGGAVLALKFITSVIFGTIFGMLGGLLGVAMFKKDAPALPPPGTIDVLPPQ